jgi:hypothetical protein
MQFVKSGLAKINWQTGLFLCAHLLSLLNAAKATKCAILVYHLGALATLGMTTNNTNKLCTQKDYLKYLKFC